jgi:hypothetical protein
MAKVKQTISNDKMEHGPKKTCDGSSKNTRLILQLAVALMEATDLNDEDASLLAELVDHSVVQMALGRKLKTKQPVVSDTEVFYNAFSDEKLKPVKPIDSNLFYSNYPRSEADMDTRCFQPNGD